MYTTRLARKGAEVTGIDLFARSIEYAREMAVSEDVPIEYVNQDYLEYETDKRFDLIIMIFCDFAALRPSKRTEVLSKFHEFLKPGGSILFDVQSLRAFEKREESAAYEVNLMNNFWSPRRYHGLHHTYRYDRERVTLDKYTIIEANRTRVFFNWLQHFDRETVAN